MQDIVKNLCFYHEALSQDLFDVGSWKNVASLISSFNYRDYHVVQLMALLQHFPILQHLKRCFELITVDTQTVDTDVMMNIVGSIIVIVTEEWKCPRWPQHASSSDRDVLKAIFSRQYHPILAEHVELLRGLVSLGSRSFFVEMNLSSFLQSEIIGLLVLLDNVTMIKPALSNISQWYNYLFVNPLPIESNCPANDSPADVCGIIYSKNWSCAKVVEKIYYYFVQFCKEKAAFADGTGSLFNAAGPHAKRLRLMHKSSYLKDGSTRNVDEIIWKFGEGWLKKYAGLASTHERPIGALKTVNSILKIIITNRAYRPDSSQESLSVIFTPFLLSLASPQKEDATNGVWHAELDTMMCQLFELDHRWLLLKLPNVCAVSLMPKFAVTLLHYHAKSGELAQYISKFGIVFSIKEMLIDALRLACNEDDLAASLKVLLMKCHSEDLAVIASLLKPILNNRNLPSQRFWIIFMETVPLDVKRSLCFKLLNYMPRDQISNVLVDLDGAYPREVEWYLADQELRELPYKTGDLHYAMAYFFCVREKDYYKFIDDLFRHGFEASVLLSFLTISKISHHAFFRKAMIEYVRKKCLKLDTLKPILAQILCLYFDFTAAKDLMNIYLGNTAAKAGVGTLCASNIKDLFLALEFLRQKEKIDMQDTLLEFFPIFKTRKEVAALILKLLLSYNGDSVLQQLIPVIDDRDVFTLLLDEYILKKPGHLFSSSTLRQFLELLIKYVDTKLSFTTLRMLLQIGQAHEELLEVISKIGANKKLVPYSLWRRALCNKKPRLSKLGSKLDKLMKKDSAYLNAIEDVRSAIVEPWILSASAKQFRKFLNACPIFAKSPVDMTRPTKKISKSKIIIPSDLIRCGIEIWLSLSSQSKKFTHDDVQFHILPLLESSEFIIDEGFLKLLIPAVAGVLQNEGALLFRFMKAILAKIASSDLGVCPTRNETTESPLQWRRTDSLVPTVKLMNILLANFSEKFSRKSNIYFPFVFSLFNLIITRNVGRVTRRSLDHWASSILHFYRDLQRTSISGNQYKSIMKELPFFSNYLLVAIFNLHHDKVKLFSGAEARQMEPSSEEGIMTGDSGATFVPEDSLVSVSNFLVTLIMKTFQWTLHESSNITWIQMKLTSPLATARFKEMLQTFYVHYKTIKT